MSRANDWLKRHFNFGVYSKIAPKVDFLSNKIFLARYFVFTKTQKGSTLRGTIGPTLPHALRILLSAFPLLLILSAVVCLPRCFNVTTLEVPSEGMVTVAAGFLTATLAIAGIFLTLFYTNAASVYSSKYPNGNDTLSRLFVDLLSSDKDLRYCGAFVITVSAAFVVLGLGWLNTLVVVYVFVLLVILIGKLPGVLRLLTEKASFTAISVKPANRFLTAAYASSFKCVFYESPLLVFNFNNFADSSIKSLNSLMDYALAPENNGVAYSKMLSSVLLGVLKSYSIISLSIPTSSRWYPEESIHKSWFMSPFYEISLAIDTGTIPSPKSTPNLRGYHNEIFGICLRYQSQLMQQRDIDGLIKWCIDVDQMFASCMANGNVGWVRESAFGYLNQLRSFVESLPNTDDIPQLLKSCQLAEVYSMTFISIVLELLRICLSADPQAFRFKAFRAFEQKELQSKGFPLYDSEVLAELCAKIRYEMQINGFVLTPSWYFDEKVADAGISAISDLCDFVDNIYDEYLNAARILILNGLDSCYIPVIRESELREKVGLCLEAMGEFSDVAFGNKDACMNCLEEVKAQHNEFVKLLPKVASNFDNRSATLKELLPDVSGFTFFNYSKFLFEEILDGKLEVFAESIKLLHGMVIVVSMELANKLNEQLYNDAYKSQVLSEPILILFELSGMAYCMAELCGQEYIQKSIGKKLSEILREHPSEAIKWKACLTLMQNSWLNRKISIDVDKWRLRFHDVVFEKGLYPESLQKSIIGRERELDEREKRIEKMMPYANYEYGRIDGCGVCKDFILEDVLVETQANE